MSQELVVRDVCGVARGSQVGAVVKFTVRGGEKTFGGALLRWDGVPGWERLLEGLEKLGPAERFSFGGFGADGELSALPVSYKGHALSVSAAKRLLKRRLLDRPFTREQFEKMDLRSKLPETFEGRSLFEVGDGRWLEVVMERRPRGPKRIIY